MASKPKKKKNKYQSKHKNPNKFHLGRNLGTKLIILGTAIGLVLIFLLLWTTLIGKNSYLNTYKNDTHQAFISPDVKKKKDQDESYDESTFSNHYPDAKRIEASEFKDFDLEFYATSIDTHDAHSISFSLKCVRNENTPELLYTLNSSLEQSQSSTAYVYACANVNAKWVGVNQYSSMRSISKTNFEKTMENVTASTITVSLNENQEFPMKTNTKPFKIKVNTPEVYLYVCYLYGENGIVKKAEYVIHYSYNDYYRAGTTSPAI